jgi:hypothetical protein
LLNSDLVYSGNISSSHYPFTIACAGARSATARAAASDYAGAFMTIQIAAAANPAGTTVAAASNYCQLLLRNFAHAWLLSHCKLINYTFTNATGRIE